ncbi:MAG: T9SS type A sorting domain-containing protein [Patescibacteria group bacterium]
MTITKFFKKVIILKTKYKGAIMKRLLNISLVLLFVATLSYGQWQQVTNWDPKQQLEAVCSVDNNVWTVGNGHPSIYHSTDSGKTWSAQLEPGTEAAAYNAVQFVNKNLGYIAGGPISGEDYGVILKTTTGGSSWFRLNNPVASGIRCMFWADSLNGWLAGGTRQLYYYKDTTGTNGGLVWRTTDGGFTWNIQKFGKPRYGFWRIQMLSNGFGWLLSMNELYTTSDFGSTWRKYNSLPLSGDYEYFQLVAKANKVYIVLRSFSLNKTPVYMSQDNGLNWQLLSELNGLPLRPNSLLAIDENDLYFVGNDWQINSYILKSTDGGKTWKVDFQVGMNSGEIYYTLQMSPDMKTGWAVGSQIWRYVVPPTLNVNPDKVARAGTPFVARYSTYKTYPGDNMATAKVDYPSWLSVVSSTEIKGTVPNSLLHKKFVFQVTATTTEGGFKTFKSDSIYVDDVVWVEPNEVPTKFSLSQNYPNPFNPSTTISYTIPTSTDVKLVVVNTLGQEIVTLVNEYKVVGTYEVVFSAQGGSASGGNASNLPSGIYFYRLTAGNFVSTKKMMYLK